jgi:hypothetical protein
VSERARRVSDLTTDELGELIEEAVRRGFGRKPTKRPRRKRDVDADIEITDTDRAAARAVARRLGMHVKR